MKGARKKPTAAHVIGSHAFFTARSEQLAALALRHAVPTVYENRGFVAARGLVSYGGNIADAYRLAGVYVARILKTSQLVSCASKPSWRTMMS